MSKSFNGRDALAELDRLTARVRQSLTEALAAADAAGARRTAIQKEQASAYAVLAQLRLGAGHALLFQPQGENRRHRCGDDAAWRHP